MNFQVAICGGGIAAIEGLLWLRRLAGDDVDITLISLGDELEYRPMTVLEPFAPTRARRYPLARIIEDAGARWERASLSCLDRSRRIVHISDGQEVAYDALLLAIGARERAPSPGVRVFTGRDGVSHRRVPVRLPGHAAAADRHPAVLIPQGRRERRGDVAEPIKLTGDDGTVTPHTGPAVKLKWSNSRGHPDRACEPMDVLRDIEADAPR